MSIKFNVLWYEDEKEWYESEQKRIKDTLKEYNLEGNFVRKDSSSDNISTEVSGNNWDLILMDYKLLGTETGDVIASKIRKCNVLADIVFYSGTLGKLKQSLKEDNELIEGCYFSKRDFNEFTDKVGMVIKKIIHRSEDPVGLRGLILEHTSEFETRIAMLLKKQWELITEDQKVEIFQCINKIIKKWEEKADKKVENYSKTLDFNGALDDTFFLPTDKRTQLVNQMLLFLDMKFNFNQFYQDTINKYRVAVSHLIASDTKIKINGEDNNINSDLFMLIRQNINEVDDKLKQFEDIIMEQKLDN